MRPPGRPSPPAPLPTVGEGSTYERCRQAPPLPRTGPWGFRGPMGPQVGSPVNSPEGGEGVGGEGCSDDCELLEAAVDDRLCIDLEPLFQDRGVGAAEVVGVREVPDDKGVLFQ